MSLEDRAYEDSRMGFEMYRERIVDRALKAHESGDENGAQELLAESRRLTYTGLMWQHDNGLWDD